jgi:hypothetical protein
MPPVDAFDDGFLHVDFRDRTVIFDERPLNLDPPQYNLLVLLIQRLGELVPLDQIDVVLRSGIDDAIRDGAEGERLEEYRILKDFEKAWMLVYGGLCSKLGFSVGDGPLYSDRPVTGLGYRSPIDV